MVVRACLMAASLIASTQAAKAAIEITQQPMGAIVSLLSTATFTVSARLVGEPGVVLLYQWQRLSPGQSEWNDIVGASLPTYTTPLLEACGLTGTGFRCRVSQMEETSFSAAAALTVVADCSPPRLIGVSVLPSLDRVIVQFDHNMNVTAEDPFNYSLSEIDAFPMGSPGYVERIDGRTFLLQWELALGPGTQCMLVANNISDHSDPACGCSLIMPDSTILFATPCAAITHQPESQTAALSCRALFQATITGSGGSSLVEGSYQWFKNDAAIPGATNSFYQTPLIVLADHGALFHVVASNDCGTVTSSNASLTVSGDIVPPRLVGAKAGLTQHHIVLSFYVGSYCSGSAVLNPNSAIPANFSVSAGVEGLQVMDARLDCSGTNIILATARQMEAAVYTVAASNVADTHGNMITLNSEATFTASRYQTIPPLTARITPANGEIAVEWVGAGVLQIAASPEGPWEDMTGVSSPYLTAVNSPCLDQIPVPQRFYRVKWLAP